jgi:hypothetical protein
LGKKSLKRLNGADIRAHMEIQLQKMVEASSMIIHMVMVRVQH